MSTYVNIAPVGLKCSWRRGASMLWISNGHL